MHTVTALMGESNWTLTYKNPADADKAFKAISTRKSDDDKLELEDDFGCKIMIATNVKAIQRSDVEKAFDGQAIMGLFQARAQGKLNAMAQRNPQLMFLNAPTGAPNGSIIRAPG